MNVQLDFGEVFNVVSYSLLTAKQGVTLEPSLGEQSGVGVPSVLVPASHPGFGAVVGAGQGPPGCEIWGH